MSVAALETSNLYRYARRCENNLLAKLGLFFVSDDQRAAEALEQKRSSLLRTVLISFLPGFLTEPEFCRKGHPPTLAEKVAAFPW